MLFLQLILKIFSVIFLRFSDELSILPSFFSGAVKKSPPLPKFP